MLGQSAELVPSQVLLHLMWMRWLSWHQCHCTENNTPAWRQNLTDKSTANSKPSFQTVQFFNLLCSITDLRCVSNLFHGLLGSRPAATALLWLATSCVLVLCDWMTREASIRTCLATAGHVTTAWRHQPGSNDCLSGPCVRGGEGVQVLLYWGVDSWVILWLWLGNSW